MSSGDIIECILHASVDAYQFTYIGNEYRVSERAEDRVWDAFTKHPIYDFIKRNGIWHRLDKSKNYDSENIYFSLIARFNEDEYDKFCKYKMMLKLSGDDINVTVEY